jgi:galactokinase
MAVLPDGEQFVGTRGGGMDHAAVLASQPKCASLIHFDPLSVCPIRIPPDWSFLVAHCLETAEKSGAAREAYNARRQAGSAALQRLGLPSYRAAIQGSSFELMEHLAMQELPGQEERHAFLHVTSEAFRVRRAVSAMQSGEIGEFCLVLQESHESLRDRLKVSSPALDRIVDLAQTCHAGGARLTGAGFGGFVVVFCSIRHRKLVRSRMIERFYSKRPEFREDLHLIDADPGPGVLYQEEHATPHH